MTKEFILRRFEDINSSELSTYKCLTIFDVYTTLEEWKKQFRIANKTDEVIKLSGRDKSYEKYCKELEKILYSAFDHFNK